MIKTVENSNVLGEYVYNGNGQRVKKIVGGQTTIFHYSLSGQLIAESTEIGVITTGYVYLYGQPLATIEGNNIYFYHNDHLGTPMLMSDENQNIVWQGEYLPFGEALSITGTVTNNLRFPGQYYDAETGLHYNYYRDYKPEIGRYVTPDPIEFGGGDINFFVYAGNNPVNLVDPAGLFAYNKPPPDTVPVPPGVEAMVVCLEKCLGTQLVITGGAEQSGHNPGSKHYSGQAVDFGFNSNPTIQSNSKKFFCCTKKCKFKFGQTEYGKGPHYHLQTVPGRSGGSGEIPSDSCECT